MKRIVLVLCNRNITNFHAEDLAQITRLVSDEVEMQWCNIQNISSDEFIQLVSNKISPFDDNVRAIVFAHPGLEQCGHAMVALSKAFRLRTSRKIDTFMILTDSFGGGTINKII